MVPMSTHSDERQSGGNFLAAARPPEESLSTVQSSRATAEVQGAMVIAKKFPRDQDLAFKRIMDACKRRSLAERAIYTFPRGGTKVEGPSIRLAEAMAQCWGNLDFGILELEQRRGESTVMAYAWDLETNTRQTKVFQVKHLRGTKQGNVELDDPRDIYEMTANQGARRLRSCILGVIPGDIVDAAVEKCQQTLLTSDENLEERIKAMVAKFKGLGITVGMIEARLHHKIEATTVHEVVDLGKIFRSLEDNMSAVSDWFESDEPAKKGPKPPASRGTEEEDEIPMGELGKHSSSSSPGTPAKSRATGKGPRSKAAPSSSEPSTEPPRPSSSSGGEELFSGADDDRLSMLHQIEELRKEAQIDERVLFTELKRRKLMHPHGKLDSVTLPQAQQIIDNWRQIVLAIEEPHNEA